MCCGKHTELPPLPPTPVTLLSPSPPPTPSFSSPYPSSPSPSPLSLSSISLTHIVRHPLVVETSSVDFNGLTMAITAALDQVFCEPVVGEGGQSQDALPLVFEECNMVDILAHLRARLSETRLISVECGILASIRVIAKWQSTHAIPGYPHPHPQGGKTTNTSDNLGSEENDKDGDDRGDNHRNNNNNHRNRNDRKTDHPPPQDIEEGGEGVALPSRPLVRAILSSILSALRHPHASQHLLTVCLMLKVCPSQIAQSNRPVKWPSQIYRAPSNMNSHISPHIVYQACLTSHFPLSPLFPPPFLSSLSPSLPFPLSLPLSRFLIYLLIYLSIHPRNLCLVSYLVTKDPLENHCQPCYKKYSPICSHCM